MTFKQHLVAFLQYVKTNQVDILNLTVDHVNLTLISVGLAILIGVPLGILICYIKKINKPVLGAANIVQAIPSMALLGFMIPVLGIGKVPAIVTVILYSLLPIIKNTYTGIDNINPQIIEAAKGIGLNKIQILFKIQIPLALPVIMAGVRISAVTAVGLMTMAAFIGAGGLGYLVFSGIRTISNYQILSGAIPACILALVVDFVGAIIERTVTPISLQRNFNTSKRASMKVRKIVLAVVSIIVVLSLIFAQVGVGTHNEKTITVGSKDFTEQEILGNLVSDMIEANTDISVNRQISLGGTQVCFSAIKSREIDMYVDYTGTAYVDFLKHEPISDMEEVYKTVKKELKEKYDIETLNQLNFNNTFTLAMSRDTAAEYGLESISDLANVADELTSGVTFEFANREDCMIGLTKKYDFEFNKMMTLDGGPRYIALNNGEVDVIDAYATDGLLKKFNLITLKDDKHFFPPYYAIPIITSETLEKYPEIIPVMEKLNTVLSDETMIELNYRVDELQEKPDVVAREFLEEKGLI